MIKEPVGMRGFTIHSFINRLPLFILKATLIFSPFFYISLWNHIIRHGLLFKIGSILRLASSVIFSQDMAKVHVSAYPEAVVWRMGFIPTYWSKIGDLTPYHYLFSFGYFFYIATLIYQAGWVKSLNIQKILTLIDFEFVKKFWLVFGVIAFLTTSLSSVAFLSDLLALVYYFIYIISLPMVPLSIYIWSRRKKRFERKLNTSEVEESP